MTVMPPSGPGGNFFNLPRQEKPIEALEDVNTILETLHRLKGLAENPQSADFSEELERNQELLKAKSHDLSKQLQSLQTTCPQALQYWETNGTPSLSQEIDEAASPFGLQQMPSEKFTELCGKMQTLHDLLLF
jgi:hypothetical protein